MGKLKPTPSKMGVGKMASKMGVGKMGGEHVLITYMSGTIIRGTLKTPNSQPVTPISIKLQRPDGCD
jgi:hypothetical protein